MLKRLMMFAPLPLLAACGEVEIPFVAPVDVQIPEVQAPDEVGGLIHHIQASEMKSLDDLRAEMPEGLEGLQDFQVTGLTISEPEPLDLGESELQQVFLSDYLLQVRVFISDDQERSDDDVLLAVIEEFSPDASEYEALVLEAAQLSRYESGGFALITEADFVAIPPANLNIPMTLRGVATMEPTLPTLGE